MVTKAMRRFKSQVKGGEIETLTTVSLRVLFTQGIKLKSMGMDPVLKAEKWQIKRGSTTVGMLYYGRRGKRKRYYVVFA